MPSYKLVYFNLRGRAELARLLFAAAGQKFEDKRIEQRDWPSLKDKMPQKTVPVLEVDGKLLPQSMAIVRYLAATFGLDGKTNWDKGIVNAILDTVSDFKKELVTAFFEKDEAKKVQLREVLVQETIPKYLRFLESFITDNPKQTGFFVGDSLTVADLAVLDVMDAVIGASPNVLDMCPKLKANRKKIMELPKIKDWVNKRPQTAM